MQRIRKKAILAKDSSGVGRGPHRAGGNLKRIVSRLLFSLLCACAGASAGIAQDDVGGSEAESLGTSDPEMLAAIAEARSRLEGFLALAEAPETGMSTFKLKVVIRDEGALEYFWVTPFLRSGDDFEGVLANTPEAVRNVHLGQTIRFPRADVVDWGYVRDGRQVGSFTVCVLFRHLPPHVVSYFRRTNGFDC